MRDRRAGLLTRIRLLSCEHRSGRDTQYEHDKGMGVIRMRRVLRPCFIYELCGGETMGRMSRVCAAMAFAAIGSLVVFAQAPQQPPRPGRRPRPERSHLPADARAAGRWRAGEPDVVLHHQRRQGRRRELRRPGRSRRLLRGAGEGGQHPDAAGADVARVSERDGAGRSAGGQRARPHRRRAVAQRERRAHRQQRGRSARRRRARPQSDQQERTR